MKTVYQTNEYITFTLDEEVFAIEVSGVESILEYTRLTKLPGADDSVLGVLNLRGKALPVVDLRKILDIKGSEISSDTAIIIMLVERGGKISAIGGLVDSVKEVVEITDDMIQDSLDIGVKIDNNLVAGLAKQKDEFIIILDINRVFGEFQMERFDNGCLELSEISENDGGATESNVAP